MTTDHQPKSNTPAQAGSDDGLGAGPDIRQGLSLEQWERECMHYADAAFFTPPEKFLFHHYDEPSDKLLMCHRPMAGMEKYVVSGTQGGCYGIYETRDVTYYLKSGTWVEVPSEKYFAQAEVERLRSELADAERKLQMTPN